MDKAQLKHYVRFYFPGLIVSNESAPEEIKSTNINDIKFKNGAIGAEIFDIVSTEVIYEGKKLTLKSEEINKKVCTIGKFVSAEEVLINDEYNKGALRQNVELNNFYGICITECGKCLPIHSKEEADLILNPKELTFENNQEREI